MNNSLTPIDISNLPELVRIAEEVQTTKIPRILKRNHESVAMLMPVGSAMTTRKTREKTKTNYVAFRAAAGSWENLETDTLLDNIYAARRQTNSRPPVKL